MIKKLEPPQLLTPLDHRKRRINPDKSDRKEPFQLLLEEAFNKTNEKSQKLDSRRNDSRTFTLGSLEKDKKENGYFTSRLTPTNASTSQIIKHSCQRHAHRPATHIAIGKEKSYHCQKCSIELASRGCTINKLADMTEFRHQPRLSLPTFTEQMNTFMNNLNSVLNELIRRKQQTNMNILRCQTGYGRQIQEVNEYFEALQFVLQVEKNKHYTQILTIKRETELEQKRLSSLYDNCICELNRILDNIMKGKDDLGHSYAQILEEYSPKIEKYSEVVNANHQKFSLRDIKIGDVSEAQQNLRNLISIGFQDMSIMKSNKKSIIANIDESRQKTVVSEYRSDFITEQSNLITLGEEELKPGKNRR